MQQGVAAIIIVTLLGLTTLAVLSVLSVVSVGVLESGTLAELAQVAEARARSCGEVALLQALRESDAKPSGKAAIAALGSECMVCWLSSDSNDAELIAVASEGEARVAVKVIVQLGANPHIKKRYLLAPDEYNCQ